MIKHFIVMVLMAGILNMRVYPCFSVCNAQIQANNVVHIERPVNHSSQTINQHNLPETVAIGALSAGETVTGFTLAEVMLTMVIVGVVAALTIPTLIQDIQDAQYKTAWKKSFSDLNQATKMIMTDNGGTLNGTFQNTDDMINKYSQYFQKFSKKPDYLNGRQNCVLNI